MLRNRPVSKYVGLTIVLSNPSRFDKTRLLCATGGTLMNNHCLQPEFNLMQCDVRLMEDKSPWLDGTKCIMLLGEAAMHHYCAKETSNNTLNEMRGSPLYIDGIPAIASFYPQDAADHKGHEQALNELSKEYTGDSNLEDDEDDEGDVKRFSNTKRRNYAFWLQADTRKAKGLLQNKLQAWPTEPTPNYHLYPDQREVIQLLTNTKGQFLDFDMETDYEDTNMLCFAFTFDGVNIYSVPILDYNYKWAYPNTANIIRALGVAIRDNITVAHNGHSFDFFVLAYKYHIAIQEVYDTLIAQHRIFPDIEKSLGHCTSYWLYQPFHKDTDSRAYFSHQQMMQKLQYCGKDVYTMSLIRKKQQQYALSVPGLSASIKCGNDSVRPYLTTTVQGISYDEEQRKAIVKDNDRWMTQYLRMINMLIGPGGMQEVLSAVKKGGKGFPNSNPQCIKYFHDLLDYQVVARTPPNQHGVRNPSLGKKAMYKLALQHENPVITFVMLYRELKKETGSLKFIPWCYDNGEVVNRDTYDPEKPNNINQMMMSV